MRLAWFSPMPPTPTGVATCSDMLVGALSARHDIDVFVDEPAVKLRPDTHSAHEFIWRHQQRRYDLTVYQLGNSSHHDYIWPYLFRCPGLTVLHDGHLHHARAAALLRTFRVADYRAEFAASHPEVSPDVAELAIAGFDSQLLYSWPMIRLVLEASTLTAVHSSTLAERLRAEIPGARLTSIRLWHGVSLDIEAAQRAGQRARTRFGLPADAIVFGCYGGLTPDKRLPQVLNAISSIRAYVPSARVLLAGAIPGHYDLLADVRRFGLEDVVTVTGYLESDADFTDAIAACDVALNLRWPSAREVSGPWLRCLAAGKPTVIIDLAHLAHVPTLDPRTWQPNIVAASGGSKAPCAVAVDILDEEHSLRLALRRLGADATLRASLGRAAREYWTANHSEDVSVADYCRVITEAAATVAPHAALPAHLITDRRDKLEQLLEPLGVPIPLSL
jgi:glycosyltransferase involved in cell wall biosynthesis